MKPINNWDTVNEYSDFEEVPAGAYVCEIKSCREKPNKSGSGTHLQVFFDVAEGEYKGFYEKDYRAQTGDKIWRGTINQNVPNEESPKYDYQLRFFKRFTNALERSNSGFTWAWDETKLKGLKIGVLYGNVEMESKRGTRYIASRPDRVLDVDSVRAGDYTVPEPRMLPVQSVGLQLTDVTGTEDDLPF